VDLWQTLRTTIAAHSYDVFISYASEDQSTVVELVRILKDRAWEVWWDRAIGPGRDFEDEIDSALNRSSCVLVLWSQYSVASKWVRMEAREAKERDIMVPVLLDRDIRLPMRFRGMSAVDLVGWPEVSSEKGVNQLLDGIARILAGNVQTTLVAKPEVPDAATLSTRVADKVLDVIKQNASSEILWRYELERSLLDGCVNAITSSSSPDRMISETVKALQVPLAAGVVVIAAGSTSDPTVTEIDGGQVDDLIRSKIATLASRTASADAEFGLSHDPHCWNGLDGLCLPLAPDLRAWFLNPSNNYWNWQTQHRLLTLARALATAHHGSNQ